MQNGFEISNAKLGRIQYWDVAKGIVMLLVILGHMPQTPAQLTQAIYTFHMPFFFVANAYFIKHYDMKVHVKKSMKSLLVPYVIVCVIEAFCYAIRGNTDVYYFYDILLINGEVLSGVDMSFWNIFWDKIADMFVGISFTSTRFKAFESVWIVWFLAVLFVAKVLYVGIRTLCRRDWTALSLVTILSIIGMRIGQNYAFLPWSLDVAMACLPFMWFGEWLGKKQMLEHRFVKGFYVLSLVLWLLLSSMGYRGELALRIYPGDIIWVINAMLGSIVMVGISKGIAHVTNPVADVLAWCGKNSIVILGIHCIEHRFFDWNAWVYDRIPVDMHWSVLYFMHVAAIVGSAWIVVECKQKIWRKL